MTYTQGMTTTQNTSPKTTTGTHGDDRRETIRQFLDRRYHGVIPVTDEMIDAVLDGLAAEEG